MGLKAAVTDTLSPRRARSKALVTQLRTVEPMPPELVMRIALIGDEGNLTISKVVSRSLAMSSHAFGERT